MSPKPFGLLLVALFTSVPAFVLGQTSPRQGPEINAAELLASSTLDLPDPAEAAEFDKTFSQPFPINDGIQRNYILATDELYQATTDGRGQIVKLEGSNSPAVVSQVSKVFSKEMRLETALILYPRDVPRLPENRKFLSNDILVKIDSSNSVSLSAGLQLKKQFSFAPNYVLLTTDNPGHVLTEIKELREKGFQAEPQLISFQSPEFLPNDPLFQNQWHLRGRGQNGAKKASDIRVTPVWQQRASGGSLIRGQGIVIGIVDSGVYQMHPDLTNNFRADLSYSFATASTNQTPTGATSGDAHGTCVAGVSAAEGFNGIGVSGVAPSAQIAGIRIPLGSTGDSVASTDALRAEWLSWQNSAIRVKNNSYGVRGTSLVPLGQLSRDALSSGAQAGTIFVFSAGNGQEVQENTNRQETKNSIFTLPVAAVDDMAIQCSYSTPGASVVISAPSGYDSKRVQGTTTTDIPGSAGSNPNYPAPPNLPNLTDLDYTNLFNGTSSAAPVVSGVTALVLQANPSLNWRDVKEIYIRSATRNDSGDSDWARNGAGFWFNHKYGAGLINASEAVRLAKNWSNLGSMTSVSIPLSSIPASIRDNNAGGLVKYFDTRSLSGLRVEHATVTTDISHPSRGELQIQLTSPAGTTSRLAERHTSFAADPADYPDWTFSTVHNWGEDSRGLWKLKIADRVPGNTGTLNSATLTLYGTAK